MYRDKADATTVQINTTRYGRIASIRGDQYMGRAMARYGEYSESEVALWRQLLPPDGIVADVGANIGAHTVALASLVPNGGVVAFEPLPFLFSVLHMNKALNGLTNVFLYPYAVGNANGSIVVPPVDYTKENNYGGFELGDVSVGNHVPLVRLDDLIPTVTMIKADVEGMEQAVLEGAATLIQTYRPILYVENNPEPAAKRQALIDYIHGLGYDLWWHYAPHYNPDNINGAPPHDEIYPRVVSHNMLGLPSEQTHQIEGLERIPKEAPRAAV